MMNTHEGLRWAISGAYQGEQYLVKDNGLFFTVIWCVVVIIASLLNNLTIRFWLAIIEWYSCYF